MGTHCVGGALTKESVHESPYPLLSGLSLTLDLVGYPRDLES